MPGAPGESDRGPGSALVRRHEEPSGCLSRLPVSRGTGESRLPSQPRWPSRGPVRDGQPIEIVVHHSLHLEDLEVHLGFEIRELLFGRNCKLSSVAAVPQTVATVACTA